MKLINFFYTRILYRKLTE